MTNGVTNEIHEFLVLPFVLSERIKFLHPSNLWDSYAGTTNQKNTMFEGTNPLGIKPRPVWKTPTS